MSVQTPPHGRLFAVFLLLILFSLLTVFLARTGIAGLGVTWLTLGLALVKGQLVGDYFMELRHVRGVWRWLISFWLVFCGGLIATAFWLAAAGPA